MFGTSFTPKLNTMKTRVTPKLNLKMAESWNHSYSYIEGLRSSVGLMKSLAVVAKKVFML